MCNTRIILRRALVMVALLLPGSLQAQAEHEQRSAATEAAREFLEMIDAGEYRASWDVAAPLFQAQISAQQWEEALVGARSSLGALSRREPGDASFPTGIPGAPPGEYAIIEFRSTYANVPAARERVVLMRVDGRWRSVGAFVLPPEG